MVSNRKCALLGAWIALSIVAGCARGTDPLADGGMSDVRPPRDVSGCMGSLMNCDNRCVDIMGDRMNCGACGRACAMGETCAGGMCNSGCAAPNTTCGGMCVDTQSDNANCGTCGNACPVGQGCSGGMCGSSCAPPRMMCGASCVDTTTDGFHCGMCGNACPAGQSCTGGMCGSGCPAPRMMCGTTCTDTTGDNMNCGACGNACAAGQMCMGGMCTSACPAPRMMCSGACLDVSIDNMNCGMCGRACAAGQMCMGGTCVSSCTAPRMMCGAACVDTQTDASNCGTCGNACAMGSSCSGGTCRAAAPPNDLRANATPITLTPGELTVTGSTVGATNDGPGGCGCTSGGDVWYRFTLAAQEVVYVDTAGSSYDTSLLVTNSAGAVVGGMCNDDAGCSTGGFTSGLQSRVAASLAAGTYTIAVGGCSTGSFTLHVQHIPTTVGSYFYSAPISGTSSTSTVLVGTSRQTSGCGGTASGEDVRWFVTCGAQQQFFSLCMGDMGTFVRRSGTTNYDPSMYIRSGQTGGEVVCNDDGGSMGGTNCQGTGGDTANYGSRLNNVVVPRGINAVFVDERSGGSGMNYTLRYTIR